MKLRILVVENQCTRTESILTLPVGAQLCGIQKSGVRPTEVTLTRRELVEILHNPEWARIQLVPCMIDKQ